jgi:hypothetical protein
MRSTIRILPFAVLPLVLNAAPVVGQELSRVAAVERVQGLQQQQCRVQARVRGLGELQGPEREEAIRQLRETKDRIHEEIRVLEAQLDANADLRSGAEALRAARLLEKIAYTRGTIEEWKDGSENTIEWVIQQDLATVGGALSSEVTPLSCPA